MASLSCVANNCPEMKSLSFGNQLIEIVFTKAFIIFEEDQYFPGKHAIDFDDHVWKILSK